MMGGRVEMAARARGEERHGRVCISPLWGDHVDAARTVRACVRVSGCCYDIR